MAGLTNNNYGGGVVTSLEETEIIRTRRLSSLQGEVKSTAPTSPLRTDFDAPPFSLYKPKKKHGRIL